MFTLNDNKEFCIAVTALNDNFVANHFIRDFEIEVELISDLFEAEGTGGSQSIRKAVLEIIEDGKCDYV